MRRKDKETNKNSALETAKNCEWAVIAVTDGDAPYCVPINIVFKDDNCIYFHCAKSGRRTDCLRRNNKVCLTCAADVSTISNRFTTGYKSAVIFGNAFEVTEDSEKLEALYLLCRKYVPQEMDNFQKEAESALDRTAAWKIEISQTTGKLSR